MKAWELADGRLALREVPPPSAGRGEVLLHVRFAGACGSDLAKLFRPDAFRLPPRWRPGHELVGTIPDGRYAAVDPLLPCTTCIPCQEGHTHLCDALRRVGWDLPGGFAETVALPAASLHPLPPDLPPLHAVLADPAAVAVHGIRCGIAAPPGRLAVIGGGAVGLLTAAYAVQRGWDVHVVTRAPRRDEGLQAGLPVRYVDAARADEGGPFDVVVDAASGATPDPLELGLRLVRSGGTLVVQNAYDPEVRLGAPLRNVFGRSLRLVGSFSYCRAGDPDDFTEGLALLRAHPGLCDSLTGERWPLDRLPEALDSHRRTGRKLVLFT